MGEYFDWYDKNPDESSSLTVQFSKLMKVRKVIANEKMHIEFVDEGIGIEDADKIKVFKKY